ncbi:nucleoside deaminase [Parasalinivibrio latis]|uniref:nucleoside deaminase n=1 Tax=Parasalinivibrio latis TaxID=2952610 RepID=UPI0030E4970D
MHEQFMDIALDEAKKALQKGNLPVGACIVLNNEVISVAHNSVDSNLNDTHHAELRAIQSVSDVLFQNKRNATIYTTLEPCMMCLGAILNADITHIVYGLPDKLAGTTELVKEHPYYYRKLATITGGISATKSQELLNQYVNEYGERKHLSSNY